MSDPARGVIGDRFEVLGLVAEGGMGQVYSARDRLSGQQVALKLMRGDSASGRERFAREAELLASLDDPGVVRHVAHGLHGQDEPWLAMEWLDGHDLAEHLARCGGRLDPDDVLVLLRSAAAALAVLHRHGLVHRDLKPGNLFLVDGSVARVKILDLGIARHAVACLPRAITRTGTVLGTPCYMAPEQARGERDVDARADVFALGCIGYECLAGEPPFVAESVVAVLARVLYDAAVDLHARCPHAPAWLLQRVHALLARDRQRRPADASVVLDALSPATARSTLAMTGTLALSASGVLTRAALRVVSVVLFTGGADATDETQLSSTRDGLIGLTTAEGADLVALADGSVLVVLARPGGVPTDHAASAARIALGAVAMSPESAGAVVTGRADPSQGLTVGELVARAAALRAHAPPGEVLVDETTRTLLEARFECEDVDVDVAGAARLRAARLGVGGVRERRLLGRRTSCVGRERELSNLALLIREAFEDRVGRVALVTAAPGMGKSRLLAELLQRLASACAAGELAEYLLLEGAAESVSAGSPWAPIARALRSIAAGDGEAARRRRLGAHLGAESRARVVDALMVLAGHPSALDDEAHHAALRDPVRLGDALRGAIETWLAAELAVHPVLLVIEDLHWADPPTVALLDALLRSQRERPFVVLATARPEVSERFAGLWRERDVQALRLTPLTERAAQRLVREVLGAQTARETVDALVARAAGNAFFLEELIRASAAGHAAADVPETVLGMLHARLDALSPPALDVLRAASVFGEQSRVAGIERVAGSTALDAALEELAQGELLERTAATLDQAAGAQGLRFRHALVRDAAYASLVPADRIAAHRAVADWLVETGDDDALAVAQHYAAAEAATLAAPWWLRAAGQALAGHDFEHALALTGRVREVEDAASLHGEAERVAAVACRWLGRTDEAFAHARAALPLLEEGSARWFDALGELVPDASRLGRRELVEQWALRATEVTAAPGAGPARATALSRCVIPLFLSTLFATGERLHAAATEALAQLREPDAVTRAQYHEASAAVASLHYDPVATLRAYEAAAAAWEEAGEPRELAGALAGTASAACDVGLLDLADAMCERALALYARTGSGAPARFVRTVQGMVLLARGRIDEADAVFAAMHDEATREGNVRHLGMALLGLMRVELVRSNPRRALEHAAAAERIQGFPARACCLTVRAECALAMGNAADALATIEACLAALPAFLEEVEQLRLRLGIVRVEALHGLGRGRELETALAQLRELLRQRTERLPEAWRPGFLALPVCRTAAALLDDPRFMASPPD